MVAFTDCTTGKHSVETAISNFYYSLQLINTLMHIISKQKGFLNYSLGTVPCSNNGNLNLVAQTTLHMNQFGPSSKYFEGTLYGLLLKFHETGMGYLHACTHGLRSFVAAIITWLFGFCPCLHRLIPKPGDKAIV